jgi:hypothetical protein
MSLASQAAASRDATFGDMCEAAAVQTAENVYSEATTLNANLGSGVAITSIPITPNLGSTIANGVVINVGGETAVVATSGGTSGASAITVLSFTPTRAHFIGETVSPPTPVSHALRAALAIGVLNGASAYQANPYRARFAWACAVLGDTNATADATILSHVSAVWNDIAGA